MTKRELKALKKREFKKGYKRGLKYGRWHEIDEMGSEIWKTIARLKTYKDRYHILEHEYNMAIECLKSATQWLHSHKQRNE